MKIPAFLCLLMLSCGSVHSQIEWGPVFFTGPGKICNNLTPQRDLESYKTKYRVNFMAGLFGKYQICKRSYIEIDLLFNNLNTFWAYHIDSTGNGVSKRKWTEDVEKKVNYLSLPIIYAYSFKKVNLGLGLQYSFLLQNYGKYHTFNGTADSYGKGKFIDFVDSDLSWVGTISYQLSSKFVIEGRINQGLNSISNTKAGYKYQSYSRQILLGIKYKLSSFSRKAKS